MASKTRIELLEKYLVKDNTVIQSVVADITIPEMCKPESGGDLVPLPERNTLIGYHPGVQSESYAITTAIDPIPDDECLRIVPSGGGWNESAAEFIKGLEYIPCPDKMELSNRPVALLLRKKIVHEKRRLHRTRWFLAYSKITEIKIEEKTLTEVLFIWEREGVTDYVASCWKY